MLLLRTCAPLATTAIAVRCSMVLVACSILLHAENARSAASYSITLQGASQSSTSPLRQSYYTATPGVAPTIISEEAFAAPGNVGASTRLDTAWPFEIETGLSGEASGHATTDDFTITGPPAATIVHGAIRFRTKVRLDRGGGLAGSAWHVARASLHVTAAQLATEGSCWSSNLDQGSDGVLAGHSPPLVEASFLLPGEFPVGGSFAVSMDFAAGGRTFGDSTVSPGFIDGDGSEIGLVLGDENGQVMDLPPGYTVSAPSWHVIGNRVTSVPDAPRIDSAEPKLTSVAPNPSAGSAVIGLSLPRSAMVTVVVTDLQGRLMRRLLAGPMSAGVHEEVWDGRRDSGGLVAPGVYLAVVRIEDRTLTRRLARVR